MLLYVACLTPKKVYLLTSVTMRRRGIAIILMKRMLVSAAILLCLLLDLATVAQAQGKKILRGHVPPGLGRLVSEGRLGTSERLNLAIGLPLRDPGGLSAFLAGLYDPSSSNYRRYLTPEEFTARFGPTESDYEAVLAFARTNGLTVTARHPNRVILDVAGFAPAIEKAFHVVLRRYPHPTEARTFYAPDTEPTVDAGLPIADVSGLNDYSLPRPLIRGRTSVRALGNPTPNAGSAGGEYRGSDFRAAYVPGVTLNGSGQTVGLLEFDGYYANDIATYESQAGLPSVSLSNELLDGFDGSAGSANDEVALDIEMAISMAPGLAQVIVYEAGPFGTPNDILNRMASEPAVKQFSSSWTWASIPDSTTDTIFQELAAQGQSFFQASGDSGAYGGSVPQPSDNPYITVVGGTTLSTSGAGGSWTGETTWNWLSTGQGTAGGGGGVSTFYGIPTWQQGIDMSGNGGSTTARNVPDVALTADNVYVVYNNGSAGGFGGTSCAAPLWAGFTALANQQAAEGAHPSVGFMNSTVYALAQGPDYHLLFHDITTGNNTNAGSPSRFFAKSGYDLCTGWGTPAGQKLIDALAGPLDALQVLPTSGFTSAGAVGGPFSILSQTFTLTNTGASSLGWSLTTTSAWLSASAASGSLAPGATDTVTVSLTAAANGLAAGTYSGSVVFEDTTSGALIERDFNLRVGQPLIQNGGFETGDFSGWTFSGNSTENGVTTSSFGVHSGAYGVAQGQVGLPLATLSQLLSTSAGQPYQLSFWLNSSSPGGRHPQTTPNQFSVSWNGNTLFNRSNIPVMGWTNVHFLVTATADTTVLQFGFRDDPWYLGLDDVNVVPVPLPALQPIANMGSQIEFNWQAVTGLVYQVQYTTNLALGNWVKLGGAVTATSSTMTASDAIGPDEQRFYRVLLVP